MPVGAPRGPGDWRRRGPGLWAAVRLLLSVVVTGLLSLLPAWLEKLVGLPLG